MSPYNRAFFMLRKEVLKAANRNCARCGTLATIVHHIDGIKTNNELSNLTALCAMCHCAVHKTMRPPRKPAKIWQSLGLDPDIYLSIDEARKVSGRSWSEEIQFRLERDMERERAAKGKAS